MSSTEQDVGGAEPQTDWERIQGSPEFADLRRRLRVFVFPMTALFLLWYLLYVLLADYAHGFMSTKLFGNITVGLVFGLLQFVSTFVITGLYVRYANRKLDPVADGIRAEIEGEPRR
ncbi:DUF485 domain-containing protein [Amycolatopsis sp. SID8362]|uniref:DUF485 domain-containing protein n=1 Tax=Amycolatopsis sp. SID8362 TaxID=2690346 RepID=UPI00136FC39E|nr:DUF485 domain-containing protein [Amycolatopsis sp. SID8362]NBH07764.1 DUF485 domain-containing protein [Amycolatopsis sp. SID8362]NED44459.1 DUF485 domain-containing protein [Amycolatopsis sp. SID8362]